MTTADFIDVGTSVDLSEALMMSVIVGSSSFLASLNIYGIPDSFWTNKHHTSLTFYIYLILVQNVIKIFTLAQLNLVITL